MILENTQVKAREIYRIPPYGSRCYLGARDRELEAFVKAVVLANEDLWEVLKLARSMTLPDAWLVSGGIYQNLWNALCGKPQNYGVKDIDLIYFDDRDASYAAEDLVVKHFEQETSRLSIPVEVKNQARVHLWYPQRFGQSYPKLSHATQSLLYYASTTHSVAVKLNEHGEVVVHAPFGLQNIFRMVLVPNYALQNKATYEEKGKRLQALWPLLTLNKWEQA
ncbi:nucleotidyltransferase family protein [Flexibacterium corallicola]|uniref:nucleotidyltransferase family protein n=1 Tax=Flexibacterium corallicola TaxID=3037259 RepID=UPI00286F7AC2|nr:nucleotidyltransferase family protein [Pseudovibrio sp. M1P-2-3]